MEPQSRPESHPRQGLWQRYRAASLAARISIPAGAVLLSCALITCVGGALADLGNIVASNSTPVATSQASRTPTATPSATPRPTANPRPVVSPNAATLGGSVAGFNNAIGSGNLSSLGPGDWFFSGPYGDTILWAYTKEDGYQWDPASPPRVFEITTQLEFDDYTLDQANAVTPRYLPPDAKFLGTKAPPSGRDGVEKTYFSQMLANTLPRADFRDENGNAVRPGTIFVFFDGEANAFWQVELGTDEGSTYF